VHCKAEWRSNLAPAPPAFVAMASTAVWWPAALKVPVGPHESEQAAIGRALEDPAWVDRARRGVTLVIERMAWDHAIHCLHLGRGVSGETMALGRLPAWLGCGARPVGEAGQGGDRGGARKGTSGASTSGLQRARLSGGKSRRRSSGGKWRSAIGLRALETVRLAGTAALAARRRRALRQSGIGA